MQRIALPVKQGILHFTGVYLGDDDNDTGDRLRWAQLIAYKGTGTDEDNPETFGREYYLLYAVGHSLVVHSADDRGCRGVLAPVSRFAELNADHADLEACPDCGCGYRKDSPPDARFKLEVTRYSYTQHPSARALADSLRKCRDCGHRPHEVKACGCGCRFYIPGELSQIGQRLLDKIKDLDPAIAAALEPAEICL